jgi:cytochrome c-550 PedF
MLAFANRELKMINKTGFWLGFSALALASVVAHGHGNVTPQPVDTTGLPAIGAEWLKENPYRNNAELLGKAIEIGAVGYLGNCASCHGLEARSGGVAPDLREMEEGKFGDEWWMERTRNGVMQNGVSKMAKYEGVVSQEAMWAIRSYVESQPK